MWIIETDVRNIIEVGVPLQLAILNFRCKSEGKVSDSKAISLTLHSRLLIFQHIIYLTCQWGVAVHIDSEDKSCLTPVKFGLCM